MQKEKRSGELTNEEIENEKRIGKNNREETHGYVGSQDTGDQTLRDGGNVIKRNDGLPPEEKTSDDKAVQSDFD